MASNNKLKNKKLNKNKLIYKRQQLIKSIAGCYGCQECKGAYKELYDIDTMLGISTEDLFQG